MFVCFDKWEYCEEKIFVGENASDWAKKGGVMRGKAYLFVCYLGRVWIDCWKLKHEAGSDMPRAWRCLCRPGGRNRLHCTGSPVAILGMPLTCPFRVVQPFATSPCPAFYQPSPRVVHLVPRRISVGVQLGFVKGKKINGSAFHADSARLALLGWKRAWIPPGDSKCYLIRNCLPFHMLFTQPSNIGCLSLSETVYVLIQVFTTYKSTNDSSF